MKVLLILFITTTFFMTGARCQQHGEAIQKMMGAANISGLSLAYIEGGEIKETVSYGYKNMDTKEVVDQETVFAAASLSKPVLAYIVMKLVAANKIDLDTPLHSYFDYKSLKHNQDYKTVTARMVLSHTSGLPNWRRNKLRFRLAPGKRFRYSGEGFVWLQKTVEYLTQNSLEGLSKEMVFEPFGMHHTSYLWNETLEKNFALPHSSKMAPYKKVKPKAANAAHSLQTTASDYAKFLIAIIDQNGLSAPLIQQMLSPQVPVKKDEEKGGDVHWGLGFGLQQTKQGIEFWHWGDNNAFKAYFTVSKSRKEGVVYFTNSPSGLSIAPDIVSLYMNSDQPGWEWSGYQHYTEK